MSDFIAFFEANPSSWQISEGLGMFFLKKLCFGRFCSCDNAFFVLHLYCSPVIVDVSCVVVFVCSGCGLQ